MGSTINLSQVTLCAVDCLHPMLAQRALLESARECRFGNIVLFTDSPATRDVPTVSIAPITSMQAYSRFMLKELHRHIQTPWALVVQWDGYVVNPRAWRSEFLEYDYIGAPWPHHDDGHTVGNGGFSLRSKRLMDVMASPEFDATDDQPEDVVMCRIHRPKLEARHGIRFAPPDVAGRFSYENVLPVEPTFGFHGAFNLWRHLDDESLRGVIAALHPSTLRSSQMLKLLWAYCELRKFDCVRTVYRRLREVFSHEEMAVFLGLEGAPPSTAVLALDATRILAVPHAVC
jgi:hypothetical protein